MSNNDASVELIPLNEYLLKALSMFISSKDFVFNTETSKRFNGSLTLVNYKPVATFRFENSPGYMPFILEIRTTERNAIRNPEYIEIKYGEAGKEKTVHLNLGNVSNIIQAYGFSLYKRFIVFDAVQGAKEIFLFVSDAIVLYPKASFGKNASEAEAKVKSTIQALESADPSIRDNFEILYTIDTSSHGYLYPRIVLIPKEIINDISESLLSQYKQIYGNVIIPPAEFVPNENVESPELRKFLEKLPLEVFGQAVPGTYGSYPVVLLPEGDYSQYLTGNERIVNLGKSVVIVFGNPQGLPQPQPQPNPAPQAQEQQNKAEQVQAGNINVEQNNLEKILNIELSLYIPDWLKPYLNKYGIKQGESLSRQEREEFAEKLWNELQKNWNRILELLDVDSVSILPTTVLALVTKFPSEYKGSSKKVTHQSGNVIEETTRSVLSDIFADLRQYHLIPLLDSFAPDQVLDLRVIRPLSPDEFERYLKELGDIVQLYKDAYLIFSFANMHRDKDYQVVKGTANLKEANPEKLKYLQDLVDAYKRLRSAGITPPLIVDKNNTLLVGSLKDLSPNGNYTVLRLKDFDLDEENEDQLKELKSLLSFAKKAFDDQYGALVVKTTISPSTLDMQVFRTIVKLLGICPEEDEICLYKARQELSAFPDSLKDKFIENVAKETGRNPKYRIQLINLFATLFALVNYYNYLTELQKEELMNHGARRLMEKEEEKANKIREALKQGLKIS